MHILKFKFSDKTLYQSYQVNKVRISKHAVKQMYVSTITYEDTMQTITCTIYMKALHNKKNTLPGLVRFIFYTVGINLIL